MNLNFKNTTNNQPNYEGPRRLKPGIHLVSITGVTEGESEHKKTPYIQIGFVDDSGAEHTEKFWTTEKTVEFSSEKIKRIVRGTDQVVPDSASTEQLHKMLTGKRGYLRLRGEEVVIKNGPQSGKTFVASIYGGFASITKPDSLKFDPVTDIKKLDQGTVQATAASNSTDDLPF